MTSPASTIQQSAVIALKAGRVCLVTSRSGKRWVVPKGCLEPGKTAGQTALQEAWEEAGLLGVLRGEPVGSYVYAKFGNTYHVTVFFMEVTEAKAEWPESELRQRAWVSPAVGLTRVDHPGLRKLLRKALAANPVSLGA